MRLRPADIIVSVVAVSVMAGSAWMLYQDLSASGIKAGGEPIGEILMKRKTAQRRFVRRGAWYELKERQPVFNLDSIRTVEDSEAVIVLNDGTEIAVGEKTLITLDLSPGKAPLIRLEGGSIAASVAAAPAGAAARPQELKIATAGAEVSLGPGKLSVSKEEGKELKVSVREGSATLSAGGERAVVKENETARLDQGTGRAEIAANALRITSPRDRSYILAEGQAAEVAFAWEALRPLDSYTIELSRMRDFRAIAARAESTGLSASLSLASGAWYARARGAEGGAAVESEAVAFTVVADESVRPVEPAQGESFVYRARPPIVRFSWQGGKSASSYLFELADEPSFASPLVARETSAPAIVLDSLEPGAYFFRARAVYAFGGLGSGAPSQARGFEVRRQTSLDPARLLSPYEGEALSEFAARSGLSFAWDRVDDAESYRFSLSANPDMRAPLVSETLRGTSYSYGGRLAPGSYWWSVTAEGYGLSSSSSPPRAFSVSPLSVLISPAEPADGAAFEEGAAARLSFSWSARGDVAQGRYALEVSADPAFEGAPFARVEVAERRAELALPAPGPYNWRVAFIDPDGAVRAYGPARSFAVLPALAAPKLLSPAPASSFALVGASSLEFAWTADPAARAYEWELLGPSGSTVARARVEGGSFQFSEVGKLAPGSYSWLARPVSPGPSGERRGPAGQASFRLTEVINSPPAPPLPRASGLRPGPASTLDMTNLDSLVLSWAPVAGATRYRVRLVQKSSPERVILDEARIEATRLELKDLSKLDVGAFYWTVAPETVEKGYLTRSGPEARSDFAISLEGIDAMTEILSPEVQFGR
jgi:hypothetical protein